MSNWSVVTTVKADKELIDIFIAYYLKIGASEIFIYLDDPDDKFIKDSYVSNEKVTIQLCDESFWGVDYRFKNLNFAGRPDAVEDRQGHNVIHASSKVKTKWLACVDIDEFIYSDRCISGILETIPDNIFSLRLKPFEAIYLNDAPTTYKEVFSTKYFKNLVKREDKFFWNDIYPQGFIHKSGLFGHVTGKCFFRTDEPLKWPGLHNFNPLDLSLKTNFIVDDFKLLHFEALTVDYFITKTLNRLSKVFNIKYLDKPSIDRLENLKKIYEKSGDNGLKNAYKTMHVINEKNMDKAIDLHVIECVDINKSDSFSYKTLITYHRSIIVFNSEKDICELISHEGKLTEHQTVVQLAYDWDQNLCYFFTNINRETIYLYANSAGRLTSYPLKKAMFFKFECIDLINTSFSIQYNNGQYFSARPDGQFSLGPKEAKGWEKFSIKTL